MLPNESWKSRGYLPHFDRPGLVQFVTYRVSGSLPKHVVEKYERRLAAGDITEIEYHDHIDKYLDSGQGPSFLRDERIAAIVEGNLLRFDGDRYDLHAWVLMPNHVHLLFSTYENHSLSSVLHSMKSYTANKANKLLGRQGKFWSTEYFDRFIRNYAHFESTMRYIHNNPVKAGLCENARDWQFGSARRMGKEV
jgi:REP element-mobilizing transposase RayT